MEPPRKQNRNKRARQEKVEEEQALLLIKRLKVLGPKGANVTPAPRESLVEASELLNDPKIPAHQRRDLRIFYSSLVVHKCKPTVVHELDEDWPFDYDMDPDLAEAWRPIMDAPLLPFVIGLRDFLK
jgi:hypothetical protein